MQNTGCFGERFVRLKMNNHVVVWIKSRDADWHSLFLDDCRGGGSNFTLVRQNTNEGF